jgi:hypothetical protein
MADPSDPTRQIDLEHLVLVKWGDLDETRPKSEYPFLGPRPPFEPSDESPGYTVNQAVALYGGQAISEEPWTIECPVVGEYVRRLNGAMPDDARQRLIPYIDWLARSRTTPEVEAKRAYVAADWALRRIAARHLRTVILLVQEIERERRDVGAESMDKGKLDALVDEMLRRASSLERLAPITDKKTAGKAAKVAHATEEAAFDAAFELGADVSQTLHWAQQAAETAAKQENGEWPHEVATWAAAAVENEAQSHLGGHPSRHANPYHVGDWNDSLDLLGALLRLGRP